MKKLAFIPEIFIWLTFTVVAGFGYAFSFFEYIDSRAQLSVVDIIIPTLVWILLAAICTFLLRMAQNTQCFVHFSKGESVFLEGSILVLLLIGGWVFRFVDYFQGVWPANLDNEFFQYAQVSQDAAVYMNPHPASRLYVGFLHIVCLFLGNIYEAGAFVQFLLLLAAVVLWYFAIRKAFGPVTALFFAAGAMLLPDSIVTSMQCNPMMLLFVINGCIALIMAYYAHSKCHGVSAFLCEFLIGAFIMAAILLDISGWVFVMIGGLALRNHKKICTKKSFITPIAVCLGVVLGEKAFTLAQAEIYGMSFRDAGNFLSYPYLVSEFKLPDLESIQKIVFSLGTHPVFIVSIVAITIYWLLREKSAFTWIMFGVLFLFGVQLLELDVYMQHDFFIYMSIVVLFGLSVQRYLQFAGRQMTGKAKNQDTYIAGTPEIAELDASEKKSEPVVTVIRFEDEPAVTVPEEMKAEDKPAEEPLIFIPKTMEIPKRVSKPKVDYAIEVEEDKLHFDYQIEDTEDFDIT